MIKKISRALCPKLPFSSILQVKKESTSNSSKSRNSGTSGHPDVSPSIVFLSLIKSNTLLGMKSLSAPVSSLTLTDFQLIAMIAVAPFCYF